MLTASSLLLLLGPAFHNSLRLTALSMLRNAQDLQDCFDGTRIDNGKSNNCSHRLVATRRTLLLSLIAVTAPISAARVPAVSAAETIGKDPACNDAGCLGVWDGLLADCPHGGTASPVLLDLAGHAGCTASQDDTPGIFAEPWDYSESFSLDWSEEMTNLVDAIQLISADRGDAVTIVLQEGRYLRVQFTDGKSGEESVGEFYFTPNDTTVQFRIGSERDRRGALVPTPSLRNAERAERIRRSLGYLKLPVLRNRRRTLLFCESDFDTFGPGSAALGSPAEMTKGELQGRIFE